MDFKRCKMKFNLFFVICLWINNSWWIVIFSATYNNPALMRPIPWMYLKKQHFTKLFLLVVNSITNTSINIFLLWNKSTTNCRIDYRYLLWPLMKEGYFCKYNINQPLLECDCFVIFILVLTIFCPQKLPDDFSRLYVSATRR